MTGPRVQVTEAQRAAIVDRVIERIAEGESQRRVLQDEAQALGCAPSTVRKWVTDSKPDELLAVTDSALRARTERATAFSQALTLEKQREMVNVSAAIADKALVILSAKKRPTVKDASEAVLMVNRLIQADRTLDMRGLPMDSEPAQPQERDDAQPADFGGVERAFRVFKGGA